MSSKLMSGVTVFKKPFGSGPKSFQAFLHEMTGGSTDMMILGVL
jgi:hypothetical protein